MPDTPEQTLEEVLDADPANFDRAVEAALEKDTTPTPEPAGVNEETEQFAEAKGKETEASLPATPGAAIRKDAIAHYGDQSPSTIVGEVVGEALAVHEAAPPQTREAQLPMELTADQLVQRIEKLQEAAAKALQDGVDYGLIPGVAKPSLFKPGAEKLCLLFMLDPETDVLEKRLDPDGHLEVVARTTIYHSLTQTRLGSGLGSCSSREIRYAYRQAERTCPACGQPAIIKGKAEYGGGWLCFKKKGGCGAKYDYNDEAITGQEASRVDNPDLPDLYNTILKMASKRSLIDAVLRTTGASAIYTQDVEDNPPPSKAPKAKKQVLKAAAKPKVEKPEAETVETAPAEMIDELKGLLEHLKGKKGWTEDGVIKGAAQAFRPTIKTLADLTPDEAAQIIAAANAELTS